MHKPMFFRPDGRSWYLLLGWPCYLLLYVLTEKRIPEAACHVIHCALDDRIPFLEGFAVFYIGWYFLVAGSLLYFLLHHPESFRKLQCCIMILQVLAVLIYLIYPSRQQLRPDAFPRRNLLTFLMGCIYAVDTPTGVFPSLHAAISIALGWVWLGEKQAPLWVRAGIAVFCGMVCLSVCFVKQHSVLDVLGAIPLWLMARWILHSGTGYAKIPPKGGDFP